MYLGESMNAHLTLREKAQLGIPDAIVGYEREERLKAALRKIPPGSPPWYYGFREATREEDRCGIDIIAEIDVGDIPFQVKSSRAGFHKHLAHHAGEHIPVLVVWSNDSYDFLSQKFLILLDEQRSRQFREARR